MKKSVIIVGAAIVVSMAVAGSLIIHKGISNHKEHYMAERYERGMHSRQMLGMNRNVDGPMMKGRRTGMEGRMGHGMMNDKTEGRMGGRNSPMSNGRHHSANQYGKRAGMGVGDFCYINDSELTADQKKELSTLRENHQKEMQVIREEMQTRMKVLRDAHREKMEKLVPEKE